MTKLVLLRFTISVSFWDNLYPQEFGEGGNSKDKLIAKLRVWEDEGSSGGGFGGFSSSFII